MNLNNTVMWGAIVGALLDVIMRTMADGKITVPDKMSNSSTFQSIKSYMDTTSPYKSAGVSAAMSALALAFAGRIAPLQKGMKAVDAVKFVAAGAAGMVAVGFAARMSTMFPDLQSTVYTGEEAKDMVLFDSLTGVVLSSTVLLLVSLARLLRVEKALSPL